LVLAAFARRQFVLRGEETNEFNGTKWVETNHDLDFIFERDGNAYGVEVKNTLGYLDFDEFATKIRMAQFLGVRPMFAARALPRTWIDALVHCGGFAMVMRYQFYPWTHQDLASEMRLKLGLPIDTPKRIQDGTMDRLENWINSPLFATPTKDPLKVQRLLDRINPAVRH
jgi:hypothetical protein